MPKGYDHKEIEKKAQEKWEALKLYETDLKNTEKDPYYLLFEFPYPSGDLHIGHWYAFAVTDIYARLLRMKGKNVLFPIGFDAFGLPAENAAMKNGADPKVWTYENMERMRTQIRSMGTSVDWSKEVITSEPSYYKWTQWLFAKLFEHNLAERREAAVKWCPKDQTVLANEQVIDGHCERCGSVVEEKRLTQWFLKITQYAERLLADLDALTWPEEIKDAQRAWIGKSEGAKIDFLLTFKRHPEDNDNRGPNGERAQLSIFTTRPDTLYGATYLAIAPEHLWVTLALDEAHDVLDNKGEVRAYVEESKRKTERERSENKEKTGVELKGVVAINPATGNEIPVYVADYVLGSYGTGAVMAVPAHDERDFAFAKKHGLGVRQVVMPDVSDGANPPREGKKDTKREVVHVILRNPQTKEVMLAFLVDSSWGDTKPVNLLIGGIEEGETMMEAAVREIREETGYTDVKFVEQLPFEISARFYQAQKDLNRHVHVYPLVFELQSDAREKISEEEHKKQEFKWVLESEVAGKLTIPDDMQIWQYYLSGGFAYTGDGALINSGEFSGRKSEEAMWDIVTAVGGERTTNYRIRDWLVSRQRYWGCPIPVVYDPEGKPHPIPAEHLPWLLPDDVVFKAAGGASPLASSKELKERVIRIFGVGWTPEYDTLDVFVDDSWYYLRYLDSKDDQSFSDQALMKKWLPVDRYSGGSEHTTAHLLYARFFHKALYDLALVPTGEPFQERFNRGIILGTDGQKMSKRWGNVVNPDTVVKEFGTDAVRLYLAFIGPYNEPGHYPWNLDGVAAMRRFLERVNALSDKVHTGPAKAHMDIGRSVDGSRVPTAVSRSLARAEVKVSADSERFKFNTALSALMVLVRDFEALEKVPKEAYRDLVRMLAPFAPHVAEHLWAQLGGTESVHMSPWPVYDSALLIEATTKVAVQVNGKRRGEVELAPDASEQEAVSEARAIPAVEAALGGQAPSRIIYVPGKILNLVAS